jgi:thimet oligopeptidase
MIKLLLPAVLALAPLAAAQTISRPIAARPTGPTGLNYKVTPDQMRANAAAARGKFDARLKAILSVPKPQRTFRNTVEALETSLAEYSEDLASFTPLFYMSADPQVRQTAEEVSTEAEQFQMGLWTDENLYNAFNDYAATDPFLTGAEKRLFEDMKSTFKGSGMTLPVEKRQRLLEVGKKLSELGSKFERNIAEDQSTIIASEAELDGLPADNMKELARLRQPDGTYKLTLDYPTYEPVMKFAKNRDLRRRYEKVFRNRGGEANLDILTEALKLREESAKIQGFKNYAEAAISDRMAKEPSKVETFLGRLRDLLTPKAKEQLAALIAERQKDDPTATDFASYDKSLYSEKLRKRLYDLDTNEIRQYFPMDKVVSGTLRTYERVLGLKFDEVKNPDAWHPDVRLFEVNDAATGRRLGHFYLDLFSRPGKYSHMAVINFVSGRRLEDGSYREPVAAMMGNFSAPTADRPALLKHTEVETFFHEFGHIMDGVLRETKYASHSGTARDWVEAPSQMLENFVWEPEVLADISGHWQDPSKSLPPELLAKMLKARNFNRALDVLAQISFATADLVLHTVIPENVTETFNKILGEISLIPASPETHFPSSFGHLFGYGAGYYGYLWSEVFAADIFTRFKKEGLFNPKPGMDYRKRILARGREIPEEQNLRDYLEREPSEKAFMEDLTGEDEPRS